MAPQFETGEVVRYVGSPSAPRNRYVKIISRCGSLVDYSWLYKFWGCKTDEWLPESYFEKIDYSDENIFTKVSSGEWKLTEFKKEDKKNMPKFKVGEMVIHRSTGRIVTINGVYGQGSPTYTFNGCQPGAFYFEKAFEKIKKEESMPKFEVGEKVKFLKNDSIQQIIEVDGGFYRFVGNPTFYPELYIAKLREDEKNMAKFKVGEKVRVSICSDPFSGRTVTITKVDNVGIYLFYKIREDNERHWWSEDILEKLKEEKTMGEDLFRNFTISFTTPEQEETQKPKRRPHPKKMLDDLGIEKVILSEKRGKAVTYVELKDGRSGKATQDVKDTPDPYVGIAIATLSAMTSSKVNFRNMVDFLVKKGQYIRK